MGNSKPAKTPLISACNPRGQAVKNKQIPDKGCRNRQGLK